MSQGVIVSDSGSSSLCHNLRTQRGHALCFLSLNEEDSGVLSGRVSAPPPLVVMPNEVRSLFDLYPPGRHRSCSYLSILARELI